jgi:peptidyl-prolyl cis-trans isomerase-like 2
MESKYVICYLPKTQVSRRKGLVRAALDTITYFDFFRNPKDKGYLTLNTTKGPLNIELRCDLAPRACENFLALCEMGYYTDTAFHRSIRNFLVQGGDPSGTGRGGESIYGPTFKDEIDNRLVHDRRGVLGMANNGRDTNASQFYVLYKSARHLDLKHTIFGAVVGGLETLSAIEGVPTGEGDKPVERIAITGASATTSMLVLH